MAASPIIEEVSGSPAAALIGGLAGLEGAATGLPALELTAGSRPLRRLAIYPAVAGFDLVDELRFLAARAIEPNVFFNPRFLAPAMPRLEDREVRLAVMRDGDDYRSRLRLLLPLSVERSAVPLGVPVVRVWSSPFGPLGTPLLDRDDPEGVLEDFFAMLARPRLGLPRVLVLPDMPLDGPVARLIQSMAVARNLPLEVTGVIMRPALEGDADGEAYLRASLRQEKRKELRRLRRRLADRGRLDYHVLRAREEVRLGLEHFLALEASGWKGRARTAMAIDRFRAAFAREAINGLAAEDKCRIHELRLDGRVIASLVVLVEGGVAWTWKTAYDESLAAFSPGMLLMTDVTRTLLEDPNIRMTDSCAVPDHPVVSRLWREQRRIGTLVVGLAPDTDRAARQAASGLHLHRETRNLARLLRKRLRGLLGRR
jgi:CelD/BcsL family acetyltransferase involved in cellulose biosynthesis